MFKGKQSLRYRLCLNLLKTSQKEKHLKTTRQLFQMNHHDRCRQELIPPLFVTFGSGSAFGSPKKLDVTIPGLQLQGTAIIATRILFSRTERYLQNWNRFYLFICPAEHGISNPHPQGSTMEVQATPGKTISPQVHSKARALFWQPRISIQKKKVVSLMSLMSLVSLGKDKQA